MPLPPLLLPSRRSIGINFRTGYLDELHVVEMRPSKIARQYAKGWLPIDIVSCLPTSYITQIVTAMQTPEERALAAQGSGPANTKIFKILRLMRLAKLLRLGRIKKIIKRHEEEMENLMGFAKLFVAARPASPMSTFVSSSSARSNVPIGGHFTENKLVLSK